MRIETFSEAETLVAARRLGEQAKPGDIYILNGDLGAGKTVFAKGFAQGLFIKEPVTSPTFTVIQEYPDGRLPFYHFDVYRIADLSEMDELGYEDYFYGQWVCLVEWGSLVQDLLPEEAVWIFITKKPERGFDYREIQITKKEGI